MADAAGVVRDWIAAFNARDVERMVGLAHDDVEFDTPRGVTRGHDSLRAFMERQRFGVAMTIRPHRYYGRDDVVVVDGLAEFRFVDTGELADASAGPTTFVVHDGKVRRLVADDDLQIALSAAGLDEHAVLPSA